MLPSLTRSISRGLMRFRLIPSNSTKGTLGLGTLRNKREVWCVKLTLAKIRKVARELLTLEEKDPRRSKATLLRRLVRIGVLSEERMKLDYVLGLRLLGAPPTNPNLQARIGQVYAHVLIRQKHTRVRRLVANIPSFVVRLDSQKHIDFSSKSPYAGGRPGGIKRNNMKETGDGSDAEED